MITITKLILAIAVFLFVLIGCQQPVGEPTGTVDTEAATKTDGPHQCYVDCKDANDCSSAGTAAEIKACKQKCFNRCYPDNPEPDSSGTGELD